MKRILIICTLLAGFTGANAQVDAGMSHNKWETTDKNPHKTTTRVNEFATMEMSAGNGIITFSNLPAVKKPVYAVLTNAEGEYIRQMKLSPDQHVMEIKKLRRGLYFISIVYRNETKKAFTLNL